MYGLFEGDVGPYKGYVRLCWEHSGQPLMLRVAFGQVHLSNYHKDEVGPGQWLVAV